MSASGADRENRFTTSDQECLRTADVALLHAAIWHVGDSNARVKIWSELVLATQTLLPLPA